MENSKKTIVDLYQAAAGYLRAAESGELYRDKPNLSMNRYPEGLCRKLLENLGPHVPGQIRDRELEG